MKGGSHGGDLAYVGLAFQWRLTMRYEYERHELFCECQACIREYAEYMEKQRETPQKEAATTDIIETQRPITISELSTATQAKGAIHEHRS